jgi:hypothetical protein
LVIPTQFWCSWSFYHVWFASFLTLYFDFPFLVVFWGRCEAGI